MPEQISLSDAFNLTPTKAIEYFESKGYEITFDWHEMQREAHTKAFTVAGVVKADILQDIRSALETAQKDGLSYGDFKNQIIPVLQQKGWFGKKEWQPDTTSYQPELKEKLNYELSRIKKEAETLQPKYKIESSRNETRAANNYVSSDSYRINEKTRSGNILDASEKKTIENLNNLLDKLPKYSGIVKRSVHFQGKHEKERLDNFLKIFENEVIGFKQLLSTTCGEVYNPDGQVLVIINSKSGVDFRQFNPREQEILFKQGTKFKLIEKKMIDDKHYITIKEV